MSFGAEILPWKDRLKNSTKRGLLETEHAGGNKSKCHLLWHDILKDRRPHNSPIYDKCQAQYAKVLELPQ